MPDTSTATVVPPSNDPAAPVDPAKPADPAAVVDPAKPADPVVDPAKPADPAPAEDYDLEIADDSPLTQEDLDDIASDATRLNLSKADAEKLIQIRESAYKRGLESNTASEQQKVIEARAQFDKAVEFSGDNAQESWMAVSAAVNTFGGEEMKTLLNTPGIGDNVVLAQFLRKIGLALQPEGFKGKGVGSSGQTGLTKEQEALRNQYPDFFKDQQK